MDRQVWFQRLRVNQGQPSSVDTTVTNTAVLQALPGKIPWDWWAWLGGGQQSKVKQV